MVGLGIDIWDFEKIDFLGHGRYLAFSAPCKSDFLTWGTILRAPLKVPRVKFFFGIFQKISKVVNVFFLVFADGWGKSEKNVVFTS